ncbi:hypothetical protein D9M68_520540 [compost metagenome]
MKEKLETFVKENKKKFEKAGPSDQLWERISASLDAQPKAIKKWQPYRWMNVAALLVVSMVIYVAIRISGRQNAIDVADVNPGFAKKEVQFASMIEEKKDSLLVYSTQNPRLYKQFTADIRKLDADYEELKEQLQTSPGKEAIVRAMLKNLEIRSNILSQQLQIINQVNQYKKENTI